MLVAASRQHRRWMCSLLLRNRPSALSRECAERMVACVEQSGVAAEAATYARLLQACARLKALQLGKRLHAHLMHSGSSCSFSVPLLNHVINMYGKCGQVEEAMAVFTSMVQQANLVSWNTIIAAYAAAGDNPGALAMFRFMQLDGGVVPDRVTYSTVLNACSGERDVRMFHAGIASRGFLDDVIVCTALITAYCRYGCLPDARSTFDAMQPHTRNVVTWTALIAGYAQSGHVQQSLELFWSMMEHDSGTPGEVWRVSPNAVTIATVVHLCAEWAAIEQGRAIHHYLNTAAATVSDPSVKAALIHMYGRCGCVDDAFAVFAATPAPDASAWNAIICAYARNGRGSQGVDLFHRMMANLDAPERDVKIATLCAALVACGESGLLEQGRSVHELVRRHAGGMEGNVQVGTSLITMYAKCGSLADARVVFDYMPERNEVSWNAILSAYSQHGHDPQLLFLYRTMLQDGVRPNAVTLLLVVNACSSLAQLRQLDDFCASVSSLGDVMVCNALVYMYGRLGSVDDALSMFHRCNIHTAVTWNGLITAYARCQGEEHGGAAVAGFQLLRHMHLEGVPPDRITFISLCGMYNKKLPQQAVRGTTAVKEMVAQIADTGLESDAVIGTALISLLGKCGDVDGAERMFCKMGVFRSSDDVVPWNAMMGSYVLNTRPWQALHLYRRMQLHGVKPDATSVVCLMSDACLSGSAGEWLEASLAGSGIDEEVGVKNACINMHAKCGKVERAAAVFCSMSTRDIISWNVMMAAYASCGRGEDAVLLLRRMQQHGYCPDRVTYVNFLNACDKKDMLEHGRSIHARILVQSCNSPGLCLQTNVVVGCALCSMYARCDSIDEAAAVFSRMKQHNIVSWNAMIGAYAQHGRARLALSVFGSMLLHGVKADAVTMISVLDACASAGDARLGTQVHAWSQQLVLRSAALDNSAVNMYAKSGRVVAARHVFDGVEPQRRTVMSWTAMVAAYAGIGQVVEAFRLFHSMQQDGVRPNHVTLISILGACSHAGLLHTGCSCFASMAADYGLWPRQEHTGCVVDMLARVGSVEQAHHLVERSGTGEVQAWMTVLGACSHQGDSQHGSSAAVKVIMGHHDDHVAAAAYVALSNSTL